MGLSFAMMVWWLTLGLARGIRFAIDPPDVTTHRGETAILQCQVQNKGSFSVYWWSVDQQRYLSQDTTFYREAANPRFSIVGDHHLGVYSLRITEANLEDAGQYHCVIFPVPGRPVFKVVNLAVRELQGPDPHSPTCSSDPPVNDVTVGEVVSITCSSEGGVPSTKLTWFENGHSVAGPSLSHSLTHSFTVEARHNGVQFTCSSAHPTFSRHRTCSVIPFHQPPTVTIQPSLLSVAVGSTVNFTCLASGHPPIFEYSWFFANYSVSLDNPRLMVANSENGSILTIRNVTADDDTLSVRCDVRNTNGIRGSASVLVEVAIPTTERSIDSTVFPELQTVIVGENGMRKSNPLVIAVVISAIIIGQTVFIVMVYVGHKIANRMRRPKDPGMPALEAGVLRQAKEIPCSTVAGPSDDRNDRGSHLYKSLHRYDTANNALAGAANPRHGIDTYSFSTSSFEEELYHEVPSSSPNHGYEVPSSGAVEQYVVMRPSLTGH